MGAKAPKAKDGEYRKDTQKEFQAEFREVVEAQLTKLDLSKRAFADKLGISHTEVLGWFSGERTVGRNDVNRVAWLLAEKDQDNLDGLLNELLHASGYAAITGYRHDRVWSKLAKASARVLKVGWAPMPFFTGTGKTPTGFAVELTERVCGLLNADVDWVPLTWPQLVVSLVKGDIDLVAPILLEIPSRMIESSFALVPGLRFGVNGIVNKSHKRRVLDQGRLQPEKIRFNYIAGGIGETLCRILDPTRDRTERPGHQTVAAGVETISTDSLTSDEMVRVLILDLVSCMEVHSHHRDVELVLPSDPPMRFSIGFGVNRNEKQLLPVINACIASLHENNVIGDLFARSNFPEKLRAEILTSDTSDKKEPHSIKRRRNHE